MWRNGINGSASVELSHNYRVIPCPVVNIHCAGHYSLRYISTYKDGASLVEYLDHIPISDPPVGSIRRMDPDRLVMVAIRPDNLAGLDFMKPADIIKIGMYPPPAMI